MSPHRKVASAWRRLIWRVWPETRPPYEWPEGADRRTGLRYVTAEEHSRSQNKNALMFLIACVVATFTSWLIFETNRENDEQQRRADYAACTSGTELRLSTAEGLEGLRGLAIAKLPGDEKLTFIRQTQPPINKLLTEAAGRPYYAPVPPGEVSQKVRREVTKLGEKRCHLRVYGESPPES